MLPLRSAGGGVPRTRYGRLRPNLLEQPTALTGQSASIHARKTPQPVFHDGASDHKNAHGLSIIACHAIAFWALFRVYSCLLQVFMPISRP